MYIRADYNMFKGKFVNIFGEDGIKFSEEGLKALFLHLKQFEADHQLEIELDVLALDEICDEFSLEKALIIHNCNNVEELERKTNLVYIKGTDRVLTVDE